MDDRKGNPASGNSRSPGCPRLARPATSQADLVSSLMSHLLIWPMATWPSTETQNGEIVSIGLLGPDQVRPELTGGRVQCRGGPG